MQSNSAIVTAVVAMNFDGEYLEDERFFDFVGWHDLSPNESLESVSKTRSSHGPYETDMVRRVEEAWRTPFTDLKCEQVRLLVGQKFGLEWLGRPALEFATKHPGVTVTNYPGEMVLLCLRAATELGELAQPEFGTWLDSDFSWFGFVFGWDAELLEDAKYTLATARGALHQS